jgi:8-oxo-dGTP pyrophosphatase MutT (NUDIX family)
VTLFLRFFHLFVTPVHYFIWTMTSAMGWLVESTHSVFEPRSFGFQVAAVCYRRSGSTVEFLLINTSAGRWTFPKGRVNDGLSPVAAAEREALEEAGVIGRIEARHFASYLHCRRDEELVIRAFLMEVHRVSPPMERYRTPRWVGLKQAKRMLARERAPKYTREIHRVIEMAADRLSLGMNQSA